MTAPSLGSWPRAQCPRCSRDVAVDPRPSPPHLARHDDPVEKRLAGWPLLSCSGSLRAAPTLAGDLQLTLDIPAPALRGEVQEALFPASSTRP